MSATMIRAQVKPEREAEAEAAAQKMFAAIHEARPQGVKYASTRAGDDTFVVLLALEGADNPLTAIPEFRDFQAALPQYLAGPPVVEQLDVIGSYGLF